jgi:hypothetical protein
MPYAHLSIYNLSFRFIQHISTAAMNFYAGKNKPFLLCILLLQGFEKVRFKFIT